MGAEVEDAIAAFVDPLRAASSGVRWVRPANLHLTLRFLGDAADGKLLRLLDLTLNQIAGQTSPFMVHARGPGAFPNLDRPRIIWIGLVSEQLIRLARQVEDAATQAGFAPEGRAYTPHLTIGRVRDSRGLQRLRLMLSQLLRQDFGSSLISEMILYRSIRGSEGSQYHPVARYRFTSAQPR
jgi:2'-5' RNA ligase